MDTDPPKLRLVQPDDDLETQLTNSLKIQQRRNKVQFHVSQIVAILGYEPDDPQVQEFAGRIADVLETLRLPPPPENTDAK